MELVPWYIETNENEHDQTKQSKKTKSHTIQTILIKKNNVQCGKLHSNTIV